MGGETIRSFARKSARTKWLFARLHQAKVGGGLTSEELSSIRRMVWVAMNEAVEDVDRIYAMTQRPEASEGSSESAEQEAAFA